MKNQLKLLLVVTITMFISNSAKSQTFEVWHNLGISCNVTYIVYDAANNPLTPTLPPNDNSTPGSPGCYSGTPAYVVFSSIGCNSGISWTVPINSSVMVFCPCIPPSGFNYTFSVTLLSGGSDPGGSCPNVDQLLINF